MMDLDDLMDRDKLDTSQSQPAGIFEVVKLDSLKRMGKLTKEAVIQRALKKAKFIRDSEAPIPEFDPDLGSPMPPQPIPSSPSSCPLPHCNLGCICDSVNCGDMYEEYYEKHCRDTGDPECMYGCICENPGPHLNSESKWITSKPYKHKRPKVRDDEDCGFVPKHLQEAMREGRPKRKAQAPTRYRPDFSTENGRSHNNTNGIESSKRTSRPRRRLCEDDDENSSDSDDKIIHDKKRKSNNGEEEGSGRKKRLLNNCQRKPLKTYSKINSYYKDVKIKTEAISEESTCSYTDFSSYSKIEKRGRPLKGTNHVILKKGRKLKYLSQQSSKKMKEELKCKWNSRKTQNMREPSKREIKHKNFDQEEDDDDLTRVKKIIVKKSIKKLKISKKAQQHGDKKEKKQKSHTNYSKEVDFSKPPCVSLGTTLHVISIQAASNTCQGMYAIIRKSSSITTFLSWDESHNSFPYLQEVKYKLSSNRVKDQDEEYNKSNDILLLPYNRTEDTIWMFYGIKKNFVNFDAIVFPELHVIMQSELFLEVIERNRESSVLNASKVVDISYLNINIPFEPKYRNKHLFLFCGKAGDMFLFGSPPPIFIEKNINESLVNALARKSQGLKKKRKKRYGHQEFLAYQKKLKSHHHINGNSNPKITKVSSNTTSNPQSETNSIAPSQEGVKSSELENGNHDDLSPSSPLAQITKLNGNSENHEMVEAESVVKNGTLNELATPEVLPPSPEDEPLNL